MKCLTPLLSISILAASGVATAFEPLFISSMSYYAQFFPFSAYAADLDGDGTVDLAIGSAYRVSILKNNGDGTFRAYVDYLVYKEAFSIVAADLDGDADMDLATADHDSHTVSIYSNNGDGTFQTAGSYAVGSAFWIFAADLDRDRDIDLAVANGYSPDEFTHTVSVLKNHGNGTFQQAVNYLVYGSRPYSIHGADFDADGDVDLATANYSSDDVSILMNNGDGTFGLPTNIDIGPGSGPNSVYAADLDGDFDYDLAVANWYDNTVSILTNGGSGDFQMNANYPTGDYPIAVFITDLDADGDEDLAVSNFGGETVTVLENIGGFFQITGEYYVGEKPYMVFAADLDDDTDIDLVTPTIESSSVTVLKNIGGGIFTQPICYDLELGASAVFADDLDGDVDIDLAVTMEGGDSVSILRNAGEGTFQAPLLYAVGNYPTAITGDDFDGDLDIDLAVANMSDNTISVLDNSGDGLFPSTVYYSVDHEPTFIHAADLDGDQDIDLVVTHGQSASPGAVAVFENNGEGIFQQAVNYTVGRLPKCVTGADFDADGDIDLATANGESNDVSVLINTGDGSFLPQILYFVDQARNPYYINADDLNLDGDVDLIILSYGGCYIAVSENNGNGTFGPLVIYLLDAGSGLPSFIIADLDGDSDKDLGVAGYYGGCIYVLLNTGGGTFERAGRYVVGSRVRKICSADLNNDNKIDLIAGTMFFNSVSILYNVGAAVSERGAVAGIVTEPDNSTPVPGAVLRARRNDWDVSADTSDTTGLYLIPDLPVGTCQVIASKLGYVTVIRDSIQVALNETTAVDFVLAPIGSCSYFPGDINASGLANGIDVTYGVAYLKGGNAPPDSCNCPPISFPFYAAMDVNGNCQANGIDITYFVSYLKGSQQALLFCLECLPSTDIARGNQAPRYQSEE